MRCEMNQMERMSLDERFGEMEASAMRRTQDIRRRMRLEKKEREAYEFQSLDAEQGD